MIKVKDGYAKLIGVSALGAANQVLLSNGGNLPIGNAEGNIPLNNGTVNTNLNADLLDGKHNGELTAVALTRVSGGTLDANNLSNTNYLLKFYSGIASNSTNIPTYTGYLNALLEIPLHSNGVTAQLYFSATKALFYRSMASDTWNQIAYVTSNITGNAASATKLQTARKLWGLSFDGTTDVSGQLIGANAVVSNITDGYFIGNRKDGAATSDGGLMLYTYGSTPMSFYTKKIERMRITSDGNVGMGTINPTSKLHVAGSGNFVGHVESIITTSDFVKHAVTNANGSVELLVHNDKGLYDRTNAKWIIYVPKDTSKVYVPTWASKGNSTTPIYFNSNGEPTACTAYSGLLTALSSSSSTNLSITVGGTTKSVTDLYARKLALSSTTITSTANDTTAKWGPLGTSIHYYSITGLLTNLPSLYGLLLNVTVNGPEVHLIWMTLASGNLYHRGGNHKGWSGSWRTILDSSNYTSVIGSGAFWKVNGLTTVGTDDIYLEMWRGEKASWKMINERGTLRFLCNYTSAAGSYYDALTVAYNTGNVWTKGSITSATGIHNSVTTLYLDSASTTTSIIFRHGTTERMRIALPDGYVGIGTTNPVSKLHVVGNALLSQGANGDLYYRVQGVTHNIWFGLGSGGINRGIWDPDNSSWMLYRDATTNVLIPYGNVGIGITSPSYKLHVAGNALLSQGANGDLYYRVQGVTHNIWFGLGSGGINRGIWDPDNSSWMLYRDATTNVLIPYGNVGIGTFSPIGKLHIVHTSSGSVTSNNAIYVTDNSTAASTRFMNLFAPSLTASTAATAGAHIVLGVNGDAYNFGYMKFVYAGLGSTSNAIRFGFANSDNLVSIVGNGNVGIGITSPSYKLHVQGNIYATSTAAAISINRTGTYASEPCIGYYNAGTKLGSIGVKDYNTPFFWNASTSTVYTIWHSGNDGSGSGLDADLLDGKHLTDLNVLYNFTFNCESLSTSNFYPLFFSGSAHPLHCKILSNSRSDNHAYNQNTIEFKLSACGWSDTPVRLIVYNYGCYSNNEITIGSIGYGTHLGGVCVWVRGGSTYRVWSNRSCLLMTSNYTYGDEVYTIGTSYNGGTNTYVTTLFVPQSTISSGAYTNDLIKSSSSMYAAHFYENSDAKLKTNIQNINSSNNIPILKEFDWKKDGTHGYGLIALELEEMGYSELVNGEEDGSKTVNYSAALSLIVGKLQVKIKELEKEIENLKNKN